MKLIADLMTKLSVRRLRMRAGQVIALAADPLATVYPLEKRISASDNENVLVITPHADDETFGAGGAIALHAAAGHRVHVVVLSDNTASIDQPMRAHEKIAIRTREFECAMEILGVSSHQCLQLPDDAFTSRTNAALSAIVIEIQPSLLYLPSLLDNHAHHRVVNLWVADALDHMDGTNLTISGYEVWSPCTATVVIDITSVRDRKLAAMRAYASQISAIPYDTCIHGLNTYRAMTLGSDARAAEAFLELPSKEYRHAVTQHFRP